jgi:deazaflavin-dependent oxidoreductase (nitroreductase family)
MTPHILSSSPSIAVEGHDEARGAGRPPARFGMSPTYRRWVLATTLGELVAFSVPTAVWGILAAAEVDDRVTLAPVVVAGAAEGAILAYAQSRALRRDVPELDVARWVRATAAAGALGWAIGMTPSTFHDELSRIPVAVLVVLGACGATVLLCSIGAAQATVLRRHVEHAGRWVTANALGWLAGLPVVFAAFAVAPEQPPALRAAFAVAGGVGMGATVALVTGAFLVRLLRSPRTRAPQPLRRRARIRLNHLQGRVYARSGGRVGGRIGGRPVLLITTTGRRSGRPQRTPVQYQSLDGELFLVAAGGGAPQAPAWWRNIEADPRVTVQIGDERRSAEAETLSDAERHDVWPLLCAHNRHLAPAEAKAGRRFPVVRLRFGDGGARSDAR